MGTPWGTNASSIIFNHAGRRTREGRTQTEIAIELRPIVETVLDELDRWLSPQPAT